MSGGDFIDSNVFVYLVDPEHPAKRRRAEELISGAVESGSASISFQVVQETLNVMTRRLQAVVTPDDARRFLEKVLVPLWRIMPSQALYERALEIQARYRYSFYDALIIAAALVAGCRRLYSEDLQHGQRIEGLSIENPFVGSEQ
jgi:predicted nucleic acid-binding protein